MKFEVSLGNNYWSTQRTMRAFVKDILVPYFIQMIRELRLPETQFCLWIIDCWSVHKSEEFRTWMKVHYPWILLCFVPGGCTSLFQPLDVGIQRTLKHAIKRAAHRDVVAEATALIAEDDDGSESDSELIETHSNPALLKLDTSLPTLRNRCVQWIVDAFHACNKKELVLKAWEHCAVGDFNCSQTSLTSPAALTALRELPTTDPDLYRELIGQKQPTETVVEEELFADDEEVKGYCDESDIPVDVLITHVTTGGVAALPDGFQIDDEGNLCRNSAAEDPELVVEASDLPVAVRRPKRAAKAPRPYGGDAMWEH
ncbi:ATP-binding cassette sub-family A member 6 [Mycena venus]|uniref:ATP-binding cassette sub-family A member 6 n=1 Tax=Mycena venus TaxID=2733690 RepID=A0A8H7CTJ4_9AGAR|nr:ATP-binding cassette sub-family A member 6 [Mycena venus]